MAYKESLEGLRGQLASAQDDGAADDLQDLHAKTVQLLATDNPDQDEGTQSGGFRQQLERTLEQYEASHPELTRAVRNVLDVLSANGL